MRPPRRHDGALALAIAAAVVGCGPAPGDGEPVILRLSIRAGTSPDALGGPHPVTALVGELRVDASGERVDLALDWRAEDGAVHGTPVVEGLEPGQSARIKLWGVAPDGETRRSVGRSPEFVLPESGEVSVPIFLGVFDLWNRTPTDALWARREGAAAALADGRVLLVGGHAGGEALPPALYHHDTGQIVWIDGEVPVLRAPSVVSTGDGVLVAGGRNGDGEATGEVWYFDGAAFDRLGGDVHGHSDAGAVWIPEHGMALFIGGLVGGTAVSDVSVVRRVNGGFEIDPSAMSLVESRGHPEATRLEGLAEPWVLVTGGVPNVAFPAFESAEVIRVDEDGSMSVSFIDATDHPAQAGIGLGRVQHRVVAFGRGQALLIGGAGTVGGEPHPDPAPLVYDPGMGSHGGFLAASADSMPVCARGVAGRLPDGALLLGAGACLTEDGYVPAPHTHLVRPGAVPDEDGTYPLVVERHPAASARQGATGTLLPDGTYLVAGGTGAGGEPVIFAEIFVPCGDADEVCDGP